MIVLLMFSRVALVLATPTIRLAVVGPRFSITPPPDNVTLPLTLRVGSLSMITPALLISFETRREPPETMLRMAPCPITKVATASDRSTVTVTGRLISTVSSAGGATLVLQFSPTSQLPLDAEIQLTVVGNVANVGNAAKTGGDKV